jgi:hypothetical protein
VEGEGLVTRCFYCGRPIEATPIKLGGYTFSGFEACAPCELALAREEGIDPSLAIAILREKSEERTH